MAIIDKPTDYFNTKLYTGTGSSNALTGVGFQPDFTWIKSRSAATHNNLYDSVRGATKEIYSNLANSEDTDAQSLKSFDTDGFTVGTGTDQNNNGATYVAWNWKAGTSVSGTTTGAGTNKSYTGSVNTTSGISIIRYQGNGTNGHTIPHHLGVTPTVMMVKRLTGASSNWSNYQSDFWVSGGNQYIDLNRTAAAAADTVMWYNTQPTSSVFTVGTNERVNYNNDYFINYLFTPIQGYSSFGKYIGTNGGADGPFIYTGFKPAFVLIKDALAANAWNIRDDKRNTYNPATNFLVPDSEAAEVTAGEAVDILSNGFKIKANGGKVQDSGNTYIYMAFAENPFVTSTGVPACAR